MHLILENFRQHKHLELDIPNVGLVLLQGVSGAGKTSILDAILFALYGEGDDIVPWGETKTKVTLRTPVLSIERTKGPVSLKVSLDDGSSYRDDIAQAEICRIYGMGLGEFLASSYIRQGLEGSLLSLTPAEQLHFVQDLSKGDYDPEAFKGVLADKTKTLAAELAAVDQLLESKVLSLATQKAQVEEKAKNAPPEPQEPTENFDPEEFRRLSALHATTAGQLRDLRTQQNSPKYELQSKLSLAEERLKATKETHEPLLAELEREIAQLPEVTRDYLMSEQIKIDKKFKYLSYKEKILAVVHQVTNKYSEFGGTKLSDTVPPRLKEIEAEIGRMNEAVAGRKNALAELKKYNNPHSCPNCAAQLYIVGGKLTLNASTPDELATRTGSINDEIRDLTAEINSLTSTKNFLSSSIAQCDVFKKEMGQDPLPEKTLEAAKADLDALTEKSQKREKLYNQIVALKNEIEREQKAVLTLKVQLAQAGILPPKEQVLALIEETERQLAHLDASISNLRNLQNAWTLYKSLKTSYDAWEAMLKTSRDAIEASEREIRDLTAKRDFLVARVSSAKRLKELADFAAIAACDLILENINENAREWLDKFFPIEGTSVVLKNGSTTKTGNERPKLSLSVFHKGKEAKKLASLSGGERSRVYLAFQLALSDMYKSPILLVDEGFTGLQPELKAECIEILKEFSSNRLVLVVEHGANESQFQEVINL